MTALAYGQDAGPVRARVTAAPVLSGPRLRRFRVAARQVVALVGENDSGRSTLMKILVGAPAADADCVVRTGRLGFFPQLPVVYERLTCDEQSELHARGWSEVEDERHARHEIHAELGFDRFARTSGVSLAFLIPFLDLGIGQGPMLRRSPPQWAHLMPGYGGGGVLLVDGPTAGFDEARGLLGSLAWLVTLAVVATRVFRPTTSPSNRRSPGRFA